VSILATLTTSTAFGFDGSAVADAAVQPAIPAVRTMPSFEPSTVVSRPAPDDQDGFTTTTVTTVADPTFEYLDILRAVTRSQPPPDEVIAASFAGSGPDRPAVAAATGVEEGCIRLAKTSPLMTDGEYDRNLIARMTHGVFECFARVAGLDAVSPTALRRWNGASRWGFGSLAEQVAAEAIVVAYCESEGFSPRALTGSNGFGYAGLFQMGSTEMARFGEPGSSRYDPADNAVGAAKYFLHQYRNGAGWGGWSPWAVVNTNFDDEFNSQVKIPVLPRFTSTDPEFHGRPGQELPAWAVDPWSWEVPHWSGTGCPFTGRPWPTATPLTSADLSRTEG
jgi:hypothetical protein